MVTYTYKSICPKCKNLQQSTHNKPIDNKTFRSCVFCGKSYGVLKNLSNKKPNN